MLTQSSLKALLHYDPETGVFTWLVRLSSRRGCGEAAGCVHPYGYRYIGIGGLDYREHRLAWLYMTGEWPEHEVDHEDRDRANNRWKNLRPTTRKQNSENLSLRHDSVSGRRGVIWVNRRGKYTWQAQIKHHCKLKFLGYFDCKLDAVAARIRAERELFTHAQTCKVTP